MQPEKRRQPGAYYTPGNLAATLVEWAVDRPGLAILEPSAGNGSLLKAVANRFEEIGTGSVLAVEIDPETARTLTDTVQNPSFRFKQADFFELDPEPSFDVVLANPPFTRNHRLSDQTKRRLRARIGGAKALTGAPGLWAYFALASLPHLRAGGTLAFVVPAAATFVDYAKPVLAHFQQHFASVELIAIRGSIAWEGAAQERAAVLLARGYLGGPAQGVKRRQSDPSGRFEKDDAELVEVPKIDPVTLGTLARIEIGCVSGANAYFFLSADEARAAGLSAGILKPSITRARHVLGLMVTKTALLEAANQGEKTLLLAPSELGERGGPIRRHLAQISIDKRRKTVWFRKRKPWWKVDPGRDFDAAFTYMNHIGPRLALVEEGIVCSNTLHKVAFYDRRHARHRTIVISMLSSYTQLQAEKMGRVYGGGVLKFELKDARALPLLLPAKDVSQAQAAKIDRAVRAGELDTARALADEIIFPAAFGEDWMRVRARFDAALTARRLRRVNEAEWASELG